MEIKLTIPFPPSSNTLFPTDRQGKRRLSIKGRKYRKQVRDAILEQLGLVKTLTGRLCIENHFWPPDRRIRDEDNYHKALRDSFTWCGLIGDDCQFKESHNYWHGPVRGGKCEVTITRAAGVELG